MNKGYKGLEVYSPTDKFVKFAKKRYKNLSYRKYDNGIIERLYIPNYKLGDYTGIIGMSARFKGSLI